MDLENICVYCMGKVNTQSGFCMECGRKNGTYIQAPYHLPPLSVLKGRYLVGKYLGEGGFGITYIARDLYNGQKVAVKELFLSGVLEREDCKVFLKENDEDSRTYYRLCKAQFLKEARILQDLEDKRGVVSFLDYFQENNTAYIVMEYLPGDDLSVYLKKRGGKISFNDAFRLLRPIMRSLIILNEYGIFHRDISPDNIRCMPDGRMKIMDFGGAKNCCLDIVQNSETLITLKNGYAPPEQYKENYKIGPWMDVYAMAATLYRCVTGSVPPAASERRNADRIKLPSQLGADISYAAEQVVMRGLALSTEERYLDMRGFYTALKKANPIEDTSQTYVVHISDQTEKEDKDDTPERDIVKYVVIIWILAVALILYIYLYFRGII